MEKEKQKAIIMAGVMITSFIAILILGISLQNCKTDLNIVIKDRNFWMEESKEYKIEYQEYRTKFDESRNRANEFVNKYNKYLNFFQGEVCEDKTFKGRIELKYVPNWIIDSDYYCDINKIVNGTIGCYECNEK